MVLSYTQLAPLLTELYDEYTGRKTIGTVDFATFQQTFKMAVSREDDTLYNLIPTVIAKNVFSMRPYSRKLKGMIWDEQRYGNYIRKITPIINAIDITNDEWNISTELAKEANTQDWSGISKPDRQDVLVTFSSGGVTFARKVTYFRSQLNAAFDSQAQVESFFSAKLVEINNIYEIDLENICRAQLANLIIVLDDAGSAKPTTGNPCRKEQVFHALTEYNAATGLAMTAQSIMNPQDFREFMIWLAAEIETLKDNMSNHTTYYHANFKGKNVNRHTDDRHMRVYMISKFANYFSKNTSQIFNPEKITLGDFEKIQFWQNMGTPMQVKGNGKVPKVDGQTDLLITGKTVDNVIGIISDVETFGVVPVDQHSTPEPINARWEYRNVWNHYTFKTPVDFTENAVLIKLD